MSIGTNEEGHSQCPRIISVKMYLDPIPSERNSLIQNSPFGWVTLGSLTDSLRMRFTDSTQKYEIHSTVGEGDGRKHPSGAGAPRNAGTHVIRIFGQGAK